MNKLFPIVSIIAAIASMSPAYCARAVAGPSRLRVVADQWIHMQGNHFSAEGNVKVTYKNAVLTADEVEGNALTGEVLAIGNVVLSRDERSLKSRQFKYNFKTEMGTAFDASAFMNGVYISGKEWDVQPKKYTIMHGTFTGCNLQPPHYYLAARELDVEPGKQIVAHGIVIYLLGHKIISVPRYTVSLVKATEQTKPLFPPLAFTKKNGFIVSEEYELSQNKNTVGAVDVGLCTKHLLEGGLVYDKIGGLPIFARALFRIPTYEGTEPGLLVSSTPEVGMHFSVGQSAQNLLTSRTALDISSGESSTLTPVTDPGKLNVISELGAGHFIEDPDDVSSNRLDARAVGWLDPIPLGSKMAFSPGLSARFSHYDNGDNYTVLGLRLTVGGKFGSKASTELTYVTRAVEGSTPLNFDRNELVEELDGKIKFPLAGLYIQLIPRYDLQGGKLFDITYTVAKVLHCLEPSFSYEARSSRISFGLKLIGISP